MATLLILFTLQIIFQTRLRGILLSISTKKKMQSNLNKKNLSVWKKEYIGSTAQKKTNKITKFLINAFLWNVASTLIKMLWSKNLVILFVFFCAVEPIYSFFQTDRFFLFNINMSWEWCLTHPLCLGYDVKLGHCCPGHDGWTTALSGFLSGVWITPCQVENPL